ncbi:uncharacterized protein H6S33_010010 [Morchella sextelata]|uniref:uncharacterized protein n=1 Tax=Morchella sextelata TaxID=1174677 RepID=UPI001D05013F|nr:uncharacterized protein H6S33_010010 [Morchella sextelata]KAH0611958.1 hypothetical protein H6S33_010010 [Morchella sextelata]
MDISGLAHAISGAAGMSPNSLVGLLSLGAMATNRVPGLEVIRDYFHSLNLDFGTLTTWFMLATALWTGSMFLWNYVWALIEKHYTCSMRLVNQYGSFNNDFHTWLCETQGDQLHGTSSYDVELHSRRTALPAEAKVQIYYQITANAEYSFRHNGHLIRVTKSIVRQYEDNEQQVTTLRTYGRGNKVLKALLQEVFEHTRTVQKEMTSVFGPHRIDDAGRDVHWRRIIFRPKRPIASVVLEDDQRDKLVADIAEYLLPQTITWYANRGLPYRRGYLLYGPPGTGKTSLSMALAAHFGLGVYVLSLTQRGLDDESLAAYFAQLPTYCIVLLEDVDASGVRRANDSIAAPASPPTTVSKTTSPKDKDPPIAGPPLPTEMHKTKVTFSGLINAIDGASASEGRILIMTTNHREHLDEALIRPGRVDLQIAFSYASRPVIARIFENLYDVSSEDLALRDYIPEDFPGKEEIGKMAARFADMVPEGRFTPAEVQGLLLCYKKDPRRAVEVAPAWVERRLAVKEENERRAKVARAGVESS